MIPLIEDGACFCKEEFIHANSIIKERIKYRFTAWEHEETKMILVMVNNPYFKEDEPLPRSLYSTSNWKELTFVGQKFLKNFSILKEYRNQRLNQLLS